MCRALFHSCGHTSSKDRARLTASHALTRSWVKRALLAERKLTLDFHDMATAKGNEASTATLEVEFDVESNDESSSALAVKAATLSSGVPIDDIVRAAQNGRVGTGTEGATSGFAFLLREVRARLESWGRDGAFKCPR